MNQVSTQSQTVGLTVDDDSRNSKYARARPVNGRRPTYILALRLSAPWGWLVVALLSCAFSSKTFARSLADDYVIRIWDNSRGLQHPTVRSLAQAPDGTILAGTFDGLARIDGHRTRVEFPDPDDHFIVSLLCDRQGDTWVGTGRSILRQHQGRWERMSTPTGFVTNYVTAIVGDSRGHVYFACQQQIAEWDGRQFTLLPALPRADDDDSQVKLQTDIDDTLWASDRTRLCRWSQGEWLVEVKGSETMAFRGLGRCREGGVWVAAGKAINQRLPNKWGRELQLPAGFEDDHTSFAEGGDGTVYAALFYKGLVVFSPNGRVTQATEADGLSNTQIPAIMIDREGSVWLGTGVGGAMQLIPRRFRVLHGSAPFTSENHISAITTEPDGRVLYASHEGNFYRSDGTNETSLPALTKSPKLRPRALLRDRAGTLWCASDHDGLWYFDSGVWARSGAAPKSIDSITEARDGSLWIGHDSGYLVLDGDGTRRREIYATNLHASVHQITLDPTGNLWLATSKGAYSVKANSLLAKWQPEIAGTKSLCQLAFDPGGTLWTTTENSLVRVGESNHFEYGSAQGVKIQQSSSLLRDDAGNWWIGQFGGIIRLDRRSLDDFAEGKDSRVPQAQYNRDDGLLSDLAWIGGYNGGAHPPGPRQWIATRRGLVTFDSRQFPLFPVPPKVTIDAVTAVSVVDHLNDHPGPIRLPAGTTAFTVEFSAIEPSFGDRTVFEYQVGEPNSPWVNVENRERVTFPSVKAGTFDIRLRAHNIDGVRSLKAAQVQVIVPSTWGENFALQLGVLVGLLALGGIGVAVVQRRRRAEKRALEEAERAKALEHARFAGILRATADLVLFADSQFRVSYINESGRRMLGLPAMRENHRPLVTELLTDRARAATKQIFEKFQPENDLWRGLVEFEARDGTPIAAQISILTHRSEDGSVEFHSIAGHDLRAVLKAESEKREAQELLEMVSDSMPIRMAFLGTDLHYKWVSGEVSRAWGRPASEMIGKSFDEIWGPNEVGRLRPPLLRSLAGKSEHVEHTANTGGSVRHLSVSFLPQTNRAGEIWGVLIVALDLTKQKESDERRRLLEGQLQQRQKLEALGTLAGGVAHDFNNLLSVIMGNLDLIRFSGSLPDDTSDALDEIQKASQRAREIVRQILLFSRQQSQRRDLVKVGTVIEEIMGSVRSTIPASVSLECDLDPCPPILADVTQIHQVVLNLVNNAVQAIKNRRGLVTLRLRFITARDDSQPPGSPVLAGGFVRLCVIDNGEGMDEVTRQRIFEPFFTTKPVGQGTGLGLAVVHGIVESHGGTISVQSKPGTGTTFTIDFPAADEKVSAAPTGPLNAPMTFGGGQIVLLVDDELAVLNLAKSIITRLGYTVEAFSDPQAAAEAADATPNRFAIAITDLTMPTMNGLMLAQRIRASNPGMPIVLTTGMAAAIDEDEARSHGVTRILAKPYRLTELAVTLSQLLGTNTN